ncbi:caspase domain-containing protein [Humibacillus xanthopallidus]|uniref:caspase family protein n=1 Tax=Humibacillus xanthopallidus TaxID=412689 RepID=UPI00384DF021
MKRALVVGIDYYDNVSRLRGCANDAEALAPLLARNDDADSSKNFDVQLLVARDRYSSVSRGQLLRALRTLFAPGADLALMYFAGHGAKLADTDADVWLVTSDGTEDTLGVKYSEIEPMISRFPGEVGVWLDSCFSGGAATPPLHGANLAHIRTGVSILTASRADQPAVETPSRRGAFSTYLEGALEGGAADVLGQVTVAGLYAYVSEAFGAFDQRPTFKANVERLQPIRQCPPSPSLSLLRRLPTWFPTPEHVFALDPSYEPTAEPSNEEHEEIFAGLQKCVAAKLIEPVSEAHMYYAAMNSRGCRLTPLGRRYRRLAADDRF